MLHVLSGNLYKVCELENSTILKMCVHKFLTFSNYVHLFLAIDTRCLIIPF